MNELARVVEALLFLSPEPVPVAELSEACDAAAEDVEPRQVRQAPRGAVPAPRTAADLEAPSGAAPQPGDRRP